MWRRTIGLRDVPPALRGAALMPAAALAVHQLRYKLAFGAHANDVLAAQGHAYLSGLMPWIVLLATLAVGASLGRLAHRWASGAAVDGAARRAAGVGVWLAATLALLAVYTGQELLEGFLATGHPGGLVGVFGEGGWCVLPLAPAVGGVLALALRGAHAAELVLAAVSRVRPVRARVLPMLLGAPPSEPSFAVPGPLARAAAGRAPPCRRVAAYVTA
jgi:hypothetical protein